MRVVTYFFLAIAVLLCGACNGDDSESIRLTMVPLRYTVPAGLNPQFAHNYALSNISTDHQRFTDETNVAWEDWVRIRPARASLIIAEPGLTWGFAQEVILKAFTDDPNQTTELFYRDQIRPDVGPRLDMIPTDFNAYELLDNPDIGLILELRRIESSPPQSLPVILEWSFAGFQD